MFWRFAFQSNAISFESLLDKLDQAEADAPTTNKDNEAGIYPWDVELENVLKDGELLPELKKSNDRLIRWLSRPDVIVKLFNWVFENGEVPSSKITSPDPQPLTSPIETIKQTEVALGQLQNSEMSKENQATPKPAVDSEELISSGIGGFVENSATDAEEVAQGRRKLAFISLEVLAFENPLILDALLRFPTNALDRIWSVVYTPDTILPHLSAAFGRVFTTLVSRRTRPTLSYLFDQPDSVLAIVNHLDDTMVLDILLKLLCLEEIADGQGVAQWLSDQKLIQLLVERMDPKFGYDLHSNVSQVLLHILAISQTPPNPNNQMNQQSFGFDPVTGQPMTSRCHALVKELTSKDTLNRIVHYMLDVDLPLHLLENDPYLPSSQLISSLTFGVTIFIEIIRRHFLDMDSDQAAQTSSRQSPTASPSSPAEPAAPSIPPLVDLGILISILTQRLPDFVNLLRNPRSVTKNISNTSGDLMPLGFERLKVCELIAELLHGSNMKALNVTPADLPKDQINEFLARRDALLEMGSECGEDDGVKGQFNTIKFDQFGSIAEEPISDDVKDDVLKSSPHIDNKTSPNSEDPIPELNLLSLNSKQVSIGELAKLSILQNNVLEVFLDLFQAYPWNNFLHVVVFDIIHQVLNLPTDHPTNLALISSLFVDCKITQRIVKVQQHNDSIQGARLGYMGYLTFIAEETVKLLDRAGYELGPKVMAMAQEQGWQEYVYQSLRDTKQRDMEPLDGNLGQSQGQNGNQVGSAPVNNAIQLGAPPSQPQFDEDDEQDDGENDQEPDQYSRFTDKHWVDDDEDDDDDDEEFDMYGDIQNTTTN